MSLSSERRKAKQAQQEASMEEMRVCFCIVLLQLLSAICSSRKNPYPPQGMSLKIPKGRGVLSIKILEAKYGAKLEFPRGWGDGKTKTFHVGSMDIF